MGIDGVVMGIDMGIDEVDMGVGELIWVLTVDMAVEMGVWVWTWVSIWARSDMDIGPYRYGHGPVSIWTWAGIEWAPIDITFEPVSI
eukprot:1342061-Amorphochlora_amoeboformis.AAC.1